LAIETPEVDVRSLHEGRDVRVHPQCLDLPPELVERRIIDHGRLDREERSSFVDLDELVEETAISE
jgi:hypothetical protein